MSFETIEIKMAAVSVRGSIPKGVELTLRGARPMGNGLLICLISLQVILT